jgi:ubiquinol-cytochrome c reductase cytochrome c1 subunit
MLRKTALVAAFAGFALALTGALPAAAATHPEHPKKVEWTFTGPFGKFDQAQLQRGFRVYQEVCAACHSMNLLSYRNLGADHGPFFSEKYPNPNENPYVKAIAAGIEVADVDTETGDAITRPATPADHFRNPFPNAAAAAAANGGVAPPDLSVITKARAGGPDYIYSLLTGYASPPQGLNATASQHYNPYFPGDLTSFWTGKGHVPPGGFIGMPKPMSGGEVTYDDGTKNTLEQQSKDVVAFLAWASEPKQIERKQTGFAVIIYLLILSGLLYASYRYIWRNVAH